jgi:hypothetical protein
VTLRAGPESNTPHRTGRALLVGFGPIVVVILAAVIIGLIEPGSNGRDPARDEARFYSVTISYFGMFKDQASVVLLAMVGASDLDSVKRTLLDAESAESNGYEEYSRNRSKLAVGKVRDIADSADESHRLFQEALGDMLMFWADRDPAHITHGGETLKHCIAMANATVLKISNRLQTSSLSKAQPSFLHFYH